MGTQYLLDTNICVFILRGKYHLDYKLRQIGLHNCLISEITVAELLYGAFYSHNPELHVKEVRNFYNKFEIVPIWNTLETFAREKSKLRREGKLIDDFDLLIASAAIKRGCILVTDNTKHFDRLELPLENWVER